MKRIKPISIKAHPEFYKIMERYRMQFKMKGINVSQMNLTKMIAANLNKKRRGFGLIKDVKKK